MNIINCLIKRLFKKRKLLKRNWQAVTFIGPGEANCKLGPGDHTGASYAFDIYDFANGTYKYEI